MLLTSKECEDLLEDLTKPEEDIFTRLQHLAPENNRLLPVSKREAAKGTVTEPKLDQNWTISHTHKKKHHNWTKKWTKSGLSLD